MKEKSSIFKSISDNDITIVAFGEYITFFVSVIPILFWQASTNANPDPVLVDLYCVVV